MFLKVLGGGETTSTFLWQIVSAMYCPPLGKVWLISVCWCKAWQWSTKQNLRRGKM